MPTISPSDLLRQKRLQLQSSTATIKQKVGNKAHPLSVPSVVRISALNRDFIPPTSSQKVTIARTGRPTQAKKL